MDVILLQRVAKLGQMGDVVHVKNGFGRNYLLPSGKALRATKENKAKFDGLKVQLEASNIEQKKEAEAVGAKLNGFEVVVVRQAGETGQLYGSVATRDLAEALTAGGFSVVRSQIVMNHPIKLIGLHKVPVSLHPEVEVSITVNVARSAEEAARQARGEDLSVFQDDEDEEEVAEVEAAEAEDAAEDETA